MQHPGRVEEEQAVKVVENHEGGTRDRLATGLRSEHGDVPAGVGSSAPETVKGRSLATRTRRRETTSCHAPRATARQAGGAAPGAILLLSSTTTMQVIGPKGVIAEHGRTHTREWSSYPQATMPPDGAPVKTGGIPKVTTGWAEANEPEAPSVRILRAAASASWSSGCVSRASVAIGVGVPTSGRRDLRERATMAHHGLPHRSPSRARGGQPPSADGTLESPGWRTRRRTSRCSPATGQPEASR